LIRLVLDTNVIVSGLLSPSGPPGLIIDLLANRLIDVVYSDEILIEYVDVLHRRELKLRAEAVQAVLAEVQARGVTVAAVPWPVVVPDSTDSVFLATALAGQAMLITGNLRHYPPHVRLGVEVLTPRAFIDRHISYGLPPPRRSRSREWP
jgi:putative PIN family toxin of toxin-antitoxin system